MIQLAHATPIYLDTTANDFVLSPEMLEAVLIEHGDLVKAVILNYPSNPTGVVYSREEVQALCGSSEKYPVFVTLVMKFIVNFLRRTPCIDRRIFTGTDHFDQSRLSKSHAMTGWRIGFIFAPAVLTAQIIKVHQYLVTAAPNDFGKSAVRALVEGIK